MTSDGLEGRGDWVRLPVGQDFSHLHAIQTDPTAYPVPYPIGTSELFPGG
jgi:hypothetical protein